MRKVSLCVFWVFSSLTAGQSGSLLPTPDIAPRVKEASDGFSLFVRLWDFALQEDQDRPGTRSNETPQTLLVPGDFAMAHLVPQDATHPLFLRGPVYERLRRDFILDHLILNALPAQDLNKGVNAETISGKPVLIKKEQDELTVNGVRVEKDFSLVDGENVYRVFILRQPLFDHKEKVLQAFEELHQIQANAPTGPPLDIPKESALIIQSPAPPPREKKIARPPAPPPKNAQRPAAPPAFSSREKIERPPAPPRNAQRPEAPPAFPPRERIARPPAFLAREKIARPPAPPRNAQRPAPPPEPHPRDAMPPAAPAA